MFDPGWIADRFDRILLALFVGGYALFIVTAFTGQGASLVVGDAAEHYEYIRVLMADGHLPRELIRFPCGVALIASVGFIPAYLAGRLLGLSSWAGGWALPLQIAYTLPLVVFSWFGVRANVWTLEWLGTSRRVARISVLFWIVTTNLAWYLFKEPAMTEAPTYAALSLYYWALIRGFYPAADEATRSAESDRWMKYAVLAGLWLGVAGMIRQQNILHALSMPLILLWVHGRRAGWREARATLIAALVSTALFVIPWVVWYAGTGRLVGSSYTEGHFYWLSPKPWLVLFVPGYHGLLLFHPAFLAAAVGLWYFLRAHPRLTPAWVVGIAAQTYLVSTWYWLSFGASVGHRGFFPIFPLLLAGFAAVAAEAERRGYMRQWIAAMAVLFAGNVAVMLMVALRILDPEGHGLPPNSGF